MLHNGVFRISRFADLSFNSIWVLPPTTPMTTTTTQKKINCPFLHSTTSTEERIDKNCRKAYIKQLFINGFLFYLNIGGPIPNLFIIYLLIKRCAVLKKQYLRFLHQINERKFGLVSGSVIQTLGLPFIGIRL